ncbi:MAG TPA: hypothetical protein PLC67_06965, partial [Spirochaetota bacterium]|nr:hypothetical protein [Spirochaetota bacterium]
MTPCIRKRCYSPRVGGHHKATPYESFLHGSCYNIKDAREAGRHKRCFTPFKSVCPFLLFAQKKWTKEKGTAARGLSGEFLAPALPDA